MATGDNVLTAISVARQCNMLDPKKDCFLGELINN
jgi:magnesium-transporting ATPase (P-type)